ncbi:MAG TPA: hypothetical protein PLE45_05685 [Spirochaetota bacterium]|nr:hypothetical protein [Spirochaetota bacterium]HPP04212.1 hypothetical protein [Spirochaetota bacterium]
MIKIILLLIFSNKDAWNNSGKNTGITLFFSNFRKVSKFAINIAKSF